MTVHWLIELDVFNSYEQELITAVRDAGATPIPVTIPPPPYRWEDVGCSYRKGVEQGSCVIAVGDIELVLRIGREGMWTPGVFATVDRFHCSHYYCHLGKYLLNHRYTMLPFGELSRRSDDLFDIFGKEDKLFVRPDSPLKIFTGNLVAHDSFDADLEYLAFYAFPPSSLVVVAPPRQVDAEWRFVVADKKIVTGTQYREGTDLVALPDVAPEALRLAEQVVAAGYEPDPVWVLDIGRTREGEYGLLEIGGFSFSNLYGCDKRRIVEEVSRVAERVWRES